MSIAKIRLNDLPRAIINIYSNHIGEQEAEIQTLTSKIIAYRDKFGDIDLSASAEFEKAKLERQLQELRKKNTDSQLNVETQVSSLTQRQKMEKQMEEVLKELSQKILGKDQDTFKAVGERVNALEEHDLNLDKEIEKLQQSLQQMLQERK